mmetsp:Transcript_32343/g.82415  ORF Transcript_32343/g.82415 Transcript_32343/m.82415 type:complete len:339 (+) Transcript_32343:1961-2977(+)
MCRMVRGLRSMKNCSGSSLKQRSISTTLMNWSAWMRLGRLKRWVTCGAMRASSLKKISPSSSAGLEALASSHDVLITSTSPLSSTSRTWTIELAIMLQNHFQASEWACVQLPAMMRSRVVWIAIPMVSRCTERIPREKKWCVVTVRRSFICSGSHSRSKSTVSISQNWVPMASASLLLSLKVALGSFCPPPAIGALLNEAPPATLPAALLLSPPPLESEVVEPLRLALFFLVWDPSCCVDALLSFPSFSSPSALGALRPCTHSVPESSILRSEDPNFWQVVRCFAWSHRSRTVSPCFSASAVTLSMAEQLSCHSSVHAWSISAVHSSPTARSRVVMTT